MCVYVCVCVCVCLGAYMHVGVHVFILDCTVMYCFIIAQEKQFTIQVNVTEYACANIGVSNYL